MLAARWRPVCMVRGSTSRARACVLRSTHSYLKQPHASIDWVPPNLVRVHVKRREVAVICPRVDVRFSFLFPCLSLSLSLSQVPFFVPPLAIRFGFLLPFFFPLILRYSYDPFKFLAKKQTKQLPNFLSPLPSVSRNYNQLSVNAGRTGQSTRITKPKPSSRSKRTLSTYKGSSSLSTTKLCSAHLQMAPFAYSHSLIGTPRRRFLI